MATTKKAKANTTTVKKAETTKKTTKKSATMEQIEKLEKALEQTKEEDVMNLLPEDIKADIEADKAESEKFENPQDIDFDAEVKKIIETAEPSDEVKEQVAEFEKGKEAFNENIAKEPEKAEQIVQEELKRAEALKKKAEAMRAAMQKENKKTFGNSDFTNWWNGSSSLY